MDVESSAKICEKLRNLRIPSYFPNFLIMINCVRWQMIAGEPEGSLEESPNTIRQHAA
jgi:hypothetical protein